MGLLLEESDYNKDKDTILIGIMAYHFRKYCHNPRCWTKLDLVYDPLLKHSFSAKALIREKDSILRFYLKCLYQKAMQANPNQKLMMDFCEFKLSEFADFSAQCQLLSQLTNCPELGFLERVKLTKLKLLLQEQSGAFNKIIHGGKIELLDVLNSEGIFDLIMANVGEYCRRSAEIWKDTTLREVNISAVKEKLALNFALLPKIN